MKVYKTLTISCAHSLDLPYDSPCNRLHGHNYKIEVWAEGILYKHDMVVDYNHISQIVKKYDHQNLNDVLQIHATAELFAIFLLQDLIASYGDHKVDGKDKAPVFTVRVWETSSCYAEISNEQSKG